MQMHLEETRNTSPGRSSSLLNDSRLQLPLQHFMLPHLTAGMRINLRASCVTLHSLVNADVTFWQQSRLFDPALVEATMSPVEVQNILTRQHRAFARMKSGKPKACFEIPPPASLQGCWSKCAATGSHYASTSCKKDCWCISVLDTSTRRLQDAIIPCTTCPSQASMWLDESRLLAYQGDRCRVLAFTNGEVHLIWSLSPGQILPAPQILASASSPAFVWQPTRGDMELISTRSFGSSELPKATCSSFKPKVTMLSWAPDHSRLAIILKFSRSEAQPWNTEHNICIYKIEDAACSSEMELQGFSKSLWSPDSQSLALWSKSHEQLIIQGMHGSACLSWHLWGVKDIVSCTFSPDSRHLAVCCRSEGYSDESDSGYDSDPHDMCRYSIIRVDQDKIAADSKSLPWDRQVLPGASWSNHAFFVSGPVWAASQNLLPALRKANLQHRQRHFKCPCKLLGPAVAMRQIAGDCSLPAAL